MQVWDAVTTYIFECNGAQFHGISKSILSNCLNTQKNEPNQKSVLSIEIPNFYTFTYRINFVIKRCF